MAKVCGCPVCVFQIGKTGNPSSPVRNFCNTAIAVGDGKCIAVFVPHLDQITIAVKYQQVILFVPDHIGFRSTGVYGEGKFQSEFILPGLLAAVIIEVMDCAVPVYMLVIIRSCNCYLF